MKHIILVIVCLITFLFSIQSVYAIKKVVKPTPKPKFSCSVRKTVCAQMRNCDEAKYYYSKCGLRKLDRDRDGIPCETICKKY